MKLILSFFIFLVTLSCSSLRPESVIGEFINFPNPFQSETEFTTFSLKLNSTNIDNAYINILNEDGGLISRLHLNINNTNAMEAQVNWRGLSDEGNYLPTGVYIAELKVVDANGFIEITKIKTLIK